MWRRDPFRMFAHTSIWHMTIKMKILSWNVLSSFWINKSNSEYKNMSNTDLDSKIRIKKAVNNILKHDPDIILLQEVDQTEYNYLKMHLSSNGYFISRLINHSKRHWKKYILDKRAYEPNGNIIAAKNNINNINNKMGIYSVKLSSNGNYCAVLRIKNVGWFASVHLDDLSKKLRNKQISTLIKWLDKKLDSQENIVIGGDLNAKPDEYLHTILNKNGFTKAEIARNSINYSYALQPTGLYDYIYVKHQQPNSEIKMQIDDKMINRTNNVPNNVETIRKYGSDHYPIIAVI